MFQCMFCSCVSGSFTEVPNWCISSLSKRGSFWFHNSSNFYLELGSWVDWDQNREQRFASNSSINLWKVCIEKNWSPYSTPWNVLTSWEIRSMTSHVERKLGREYLCTFPWNCHPVSHLSLHYFWKSAYKSFVGIRALCPMRSWMLLHTKSYASLYWLLFTYLISHILCKWFASEINYICVSVCFGWLWRCVWVCYLIWKGEFVC